MKKKSLAMAIASGVLATGIVAASTPAFAAVDFSSATWTVGGINYEFENTGSDAYMGSLQYMTTATQTNYTAYYANEFYVQGGGDVASDYPYCYESNATESTDATTGDVTVVCGASEWESGSDLYASGQTRFYSDTPMARNIWTFENRGTTDIDLGTTYLYEYLNETDKGATSSDATACTDIVDADNWTLQSGLSDTMILGFAWQAKGQTVYSPSEACDDTYYYLYIDDTVIPAGKTVHFMTFQYSAAPADSSTDAMDAAYASLLPAMTMFDSLDAKLCRGIEGETVYGWGTCPTTLPDTGVSSAQAGVFAAGAGVLALAGVALMVIRRRRNA